MSDTAPLTTLLAPLGASVVAAVLTGGLTYLGVRRSSGLTAALSREDRESRETDAREDRINERVDAFLANQTQELTALRSENLLIAQRLDALWTQFRIAQDDIVVCQRDRAIQATQVATLTVSNATLLARVAQLEAGSP